MIVYDDTMFVNENKSQQATNHFKNPFCRGEACLAPTERTEF